MAKIGYESGRKGYDYESIQRRRFVFSSSLFLLQYVATTHHAKCLFVSELLDVHTWVAAVKSCGLCVSSIQGQGQPGQAAVAAPPHWALGSMPAQ